MNPIVRTVFNMMAQQGGDASLIEVGVAAYNPTTSKVTTTEVQYDIRVITFDYMPRNNGTGVEANSLIRFGDKQFFVKPDINVPAPVPKTNYILFQGVKYNIIVVKEVNPSGTSPILYEVYGRV